MPIQLSFLTKDLLRWTMGEKLEDFNYSDLLTTETHLESLILTKMDTSTFIEHNLRYTQEFGD